MRFAVGLSALVVVMGLASMALNLQHVGMMLVSLAGVLFALVPLGLFGWVMRRGMTPGGVLGKSRDHQDERVRGQR